MTMTANELMANSRTRNFILLCSYCMAPMQKSTLLSAIVDKGHKVFSIRSTQNPLGDLHSATKPLDSPSRT